MGSGGYVGPPHHPELWLVASWCGRRCDRVPGYEHTDNATKFLNKQVNQST